MKKEIISHKQAISIMILFVSGSSLILGTAAQAKADIWLAIIIAILGSLLLVSIYSKILSLFPGKNLYDIVEIVFGKLIGKIISVFYIWYSFYLGCLILVNYYEFVSVVALGGTPKIFIMSVFMILVMWVSKEGIEVLGRWSEVFVIVLYTIIIILVALLILEVETNNLKPFLYDGIKPVLSATYSTISFPFAETVVFLLIFDCIGKKGKSFKEYFRVYSLGILLGGVIIFISGIIELLSLGQLYYKISYFPFYTAVSRINIKEFLQRMEITVSVMFLIGVFVKISVCILAASKGVAKVFNTHDYRFIVTPICILCIIVASTTYTSTMEMFEWAFTTYEYYALPFQIILPIIILIASKIKLRNINKN